MQLYRDAPTRTWAAWLWAHTVCRRLDRHRDETLPHAAIPGRLVTRCRDCGRVLPGPPPATPVHPGTCGQASLGGLACQLPFGHPGAHYHPSYGAWSPSP